MVEPTFIAVVVGVFLVLLVVILRSGDKQPVKTAKNQREKPTKPQKAKKSSKRPNKRVIENPLAFTPIQGPANNENDAKEILEFLKGKDPNEAAKLYANQQKQQQQQQQQQAGNKKRKAKNEPAHEDSKDSHAKGSEEGFTVIKKEKKEKKETNEKKETGGEEPKKGKKSKRFYKVGIVEADQKDKDQKARGRKKRKQDEETGVPTSEEPEEEGKRKNNKPQTEGQPDSENKPRRERRERKEGEKESESDGKERKEGEKRRDGIPPPGRRAFTAAAPTVKYEQAPLDDILQSISTSYQPKNKGVRHHTIFSKLSRTLVLQILSKLEAKDIIALSRVNHFFLNISKRDDIWEALAKRDFGIKELGKYRNFKAAYRGEYTKRRSQKRREEKEKKNPKKEDMPKDDLKDKKGKKEEKKEEVADE